MSEARSARGSPPSILLAAGMRPFFLLAGAYASLSLAAWLASYAGVWTVPTPWPPSQWHGHEMVFGFAAAAVSGFLLTAVPEWTGTPRVSGTRLGVVVGAWLLGRIALWASSLLPAAGVAVADLLLLPALLWLVAPPIYRARRAQNYPFPVLLALLFAANLAFHLGLTAATTAPSQTGLVAAVYVLIVLVTIISGRIVPAFTRNALQRQGVAIEVRSSPALEKLTLTVLGIAILVDLTTVDGPASGATALAAAAVLALRARRWRARWTLGQPILWVLHAAHAWLVVGFACKGVADLGGVFPATSAFHALTAGAIGTMVLAVMSRAALGHTGRPLRVSRTIVVAYVLVILGAAVRVSLPSLAPPWYAESVLLGGLIWMMGYVLFTVAYWPVLTRPRVDGQGG